MTEKPNQPREYDAVLGGKNSLPVNAAVLGGIEGAKRRLTATDELVRVAAVREAMKYGEAGLDLAIASLEDYSWQVRQAVLNLLEEKLSHPKVKLLLGKKLRLINNKLIKTYREEFETVLVNARGEIIKRKRCQAEMFAEHLGGPSARQEQRQRRSARQEQRQRCCPRLAPGSSCPRLAPRDSVELEMVSIPGGSFMMGSPNTEQRYQGYKGREEPQHRVKVPPFFIGKYPVTQRQYQEVMGDNPSGFKGANRPVESVTWNDAREFCQRLSQKTGKTYRLPSEAQWEYACRGGTTTAFYCGETITTDLANFDGGCICCSGLGNVYRGETTDVNSFPPNAFGLYDLHGNVWEYCQDAWHKNYNGAPTDGSVWESDGDDFLPLLRGGSWMYCPKSIRSAIRYEYVPGVGYNHRGFRVVLDM